MYDCSLRKIVPRVNNVKFIDKISPFIVMDVLAKARKMPGAIHMEVGEPDLSASEKVEDAYITISFLKILTM